MSERREAQAAGEVRAVGLVPHRERAQHTALLREPELLQPPLQELPRRQPPFLLTTLRGRLIGTQKDVSPRHGHPDGVGNALLRFEGSFLHGDHCSGQ